MAIFDEETSCRPGSLTKAVVGKAIESYLRTLAELHGADSGEALTIHSRIDTSSSSYGATIRRVKVCWIATLELDSGTISEEEKEAAFAALISDLGSA